MNFLNFWFDAIKKQSFINLSQYGSKCYALVVLGNSMVTFLEAGKDAAFFSASLAWQNWSSK